jgi:hypothetical protein
MRGFEDGRRILEADRSNDSEEDMIGLVDRV